MKSIKNLLLSFLLMIPISLVYSQGNDPNPHPYPHADTAQNCVLKLGYIGYANGSYLVNFTNKQSCEVKILVKYQHRRDTFLFIPGNTTQLVSLNGDKDTGVVISAKVLTRCNPPACFDDFWVQIYADGNKGILLPVHFQSVTAVRNNNMLSVRFKVGEQTDIEYYNLRLSKNGKDWKVVHILFPRDMEANSTYTINIDLNKVN